MPPLQAYPDIITVLSFRSLGAASMRSACIYITTKGQIIMPLNVDTTHIIREGSALPKLSHTERERYVFP
jgi:hypothetical protein